MINNVLSWQLFEMCKQSVSCVAYQGCNFEVDWRQVPFTPTRHTGNKALTTWLNVAHKNRNNKLVKLSLKLHTVLICSREPLLAAWQTWRVMASAFFTLILGYSARTHWNMNNTWSNLEWWNTLFYLFSTTTNFCGSFFQLKLMYISYTTAADELQVPTCSIFKSLV